MVYTLPTAFTSTHTLVFYDYTTDQDFTKQNLLYPYAGQKDAEIPIKREIP